MVVLVSVVVRTPEYDKKELINDDGGKDDREKKHEKSKFALFQTLSL